MNIPKLKGKISEQNIKKKDLASALNISTQALSKKFSGHTRFNTDDIEHICTVVKFESDTEKVEIFLNSTSQ